MMPETCYGSHKVDRSVLTEIARICREHGKETRGPIPVSHLMPYVEGIIVSGIGAVSIATCQSLEGARLFGVTYTRACYRSPRRSFSLEVLPDEVPEVIPFIARLARDLPCTYLSDCETPLAGAWLGADHVIYSYTERFGERYNRDPNSKFYDTGVSVPLDELIRTLMNGDDGGKPSAAWWRSGLQLIK